MDAFELLKQDHSKVSKLFSEIESASEGTKAGLFSQLKAELDLHAHIEETILYPALENTEEAREITLEAYEEHKVVKDLLGELANSGAINEEWDAKLTVLKENVEHHVEEEEGELFDKARKALGEERIDSLGARMEAEKAAKTGGAPKTRSAERKTKAPAKKPAASKKESPGVLQRLANLVGLGEPSSDALVSKTREPASASRKASSKKSGSKSGSKAKSSSKASGAGASTGAKSAKPKPRASSKKTGGKTRSSRKATANNRKKPVSRASATKSAARSSANQRVKARGAGATKSTRAKKSSTKSRSKSR
jgi:hemerythrin superfamily protein